MSHRRSHRQTRQAKAFVRLEKKKRIKRLGNNMKNTTGAPKLFFTIPKNETPNSCTTPFAIMPENNHSTSSDRSDAERSVVQWTVLPCKAPGQPG
jgi:hypothetical protein